MIVKTTTTINGAEYDYSYSDSGYMIKRDGSIYSEAIDPVGSGREYTETDILIEGEDASAVRTPGTYAAVGEEVTV